MTLLESRVSFNLDWVVKKVSGRVYVVGARAIFPLLYNYDITNVKCYKITILQIVNLKNYNILNPFFIIANH